MGGWAHNNFYAYTSNVTKNGGKLEITALTTNNASVRMVTNPSNISVNTGADGMVPTTFALNGNNKCKLVINSMGGSNVGFVTVNIGGKLVPINGAGTYYVDLGSATTSYIWVQINAYAWNGNHCYIQELYFYK